MKIGIKNNQMKKYSVIIGILLFCEILIGQKLEYTCKSNNGLRVSLSVTPGSKPLNYLKTQVIIYKYDLQIANEANHSFYIYKYKNNLYLLDGFATKLNHTKDQSLFSIPHRSTYSLNLNGVLENGILGLSNFTTINGQTFYKYSLSAERNELFLSEIFFDSNLNITELDFNSNGKLCSCTKSNVIVKLR